MSEQLWQEIPSDKRKTDPCENGKEFIGHKELREKLGVDFYFATPYSGKRLSEIQTKLCLAWFIARDTVPHTTAHRYIILGRGY
nr:hypothetical protein [Microcystis aeruginosa]